MGITIGPGIIIGGGISISFVSSAANDPNFYYVTTLLSQVIVQILT